MAEPGSPDADEGIGSILPPGAGQGAPGGGPAVVPFGDGTEILQGGAGPAAGHYRVDPERAPEAIADFRAMAVEFDQLRKIALELGQIAPPGLDGVSVNAAREMEQRAVGPQGSLLVAMEQAAARCTGIADGLQAQLEAFLAAEDASTMRGDGSSL